MGWRDLNRLYLKLERPELPISFTYFNLNLVRSTQNLVSWHDIRYKLFWWALRGAQKEHGPALDSAPTLALNVPLTLTLTLTLTLALSLTLSTTLLEMTNIT